jgi:hypothetical protein
MLINSSYGIQDYQIVGEPDWLRTERLIRALRARGCFPAIVVRKRPIDFLEDVL